MQWLLAQGKKYGFGANLLKKVEYIYRSSAEELAAQSDLLRFTYFVEVLKTMGWLDFMVSRKEWDQHWKSSNTTSAIYTPRIFSPLLTRMANLSKHSQYDLLGISPVFFPLLEQCHLRAQQQPNHEGFSVFHLNPYGSNSPPLAALSE